jgi:hypothetical protein
LRNARLACRSWARALAPHVRRIRLDLAAAAAAAPIPALAGAAAFPCARVAELDARAGLADARAARSAARAVGAALWRTLDTVRIVDAGGGGDDDGDDSESATEDEQHASEQQQQQQPTPPTPPPPPPPPPPQRPSSIPRLLACGHRRGASASDFDDLELSPAATTTSFPAHQVRRWLVSEVARGAREAAAAEAATAAAAPPSPVLSSLDLSGGPLPRPGDLRRLLRALPRAPRALWLAAPADTARKLTGAHVEAATEGGRGRAGAPASSSPLESLEIIFRAADGVPARPLVLFGTDSSSSSSSSSSSESSSTTTTTTTTTTTPLLPRDRLALTYTGPPELAGSVQAFAAAAPSDGDADGDNNSGDNNNAPTLTHLTLDMVALPLVPRVLSPLSTHLTVLRLRQREAFTAAEAALLGRSCPDVTALSLSPVPWALVPLAVGRRRRLLELDLGIVDARGGGGVVAGGSASGDDAEGTAPRATVAAAASPSPFEFRDDDDDDDSGGDESYDVYMDHSPAPRRTMRRWGSTLGLGLTASRTGSMVGSAPLPRGGPGAAAATTTTSTSAPLPPTAALLKALRRSGARLTFLAVDATRPLSLRPADVAAVGRACPRLEALELGARLEQGTVGFGGGAFPVLRSLSLRGARTEAADAWTPAEWDGDSNRAGGGSASSSSDDAHLCNGAGRRWSFWSRAPRHRRAVTDPLVLVPEALPRTLEALECRDVWACVPATLDPLECAGDAGVDASTSCGRRPPPPLELPTPALRRLALRYVVGACPACAPPLPMLRWPVEEEEEAAASAAAAAAAAIARARSAPPPSSSGGGGKSSSSSSSSSSGGKHGRASAGGASLRDWLLRPLLTLAEAALAPSGPDNNSDRGAAAADGNNDADDDEDDDGDDRAAGRDQAAGRQERRRRRATPGRAPQPTLTFLPPNTTLPSLPPSATGGLVSLELALPCDGPCCACGNGNACSAAAAAATVRAPSRRLRSFTAALGANNAASSSVPPSRAASLGPPPPPPTPLKLALHFPRPARRATLPEANAAHVARALSSVLPRALALASSPAGSPAALAALRLLCNGDVRCGGESGPGCASHEAALLRESAARQLGAVSAAPVAASVVVDYVHDPLPHQSGYRGMQCPCRVAAAPARASSGGIGGGAAIGRRGSVAGAS